ncbi:MAG: tetratricopeptide repeat protein [Nostoc sp.]|uniref:tetratricopeptide repeat protein n=1 Tax=Nostoc sp. TaxID=1180 RepID=UPI002FF6C363
MSNTQELALSIQPVISYPRQAQVGKTYLMTIDLQSSEDEWPYEEEEYPIYCMLDTSPLFSCQPLGEPAVVLHRFGGSYGAARFLLTAAQEEIQGEIKVTLVNGWGMPIRVLSLDQISVTQVLTPSILTIESYERVTSVTQESGRSSSTIRRRNPYIIGTPIDSPEKLFGRETILKDIEASLQQNAQFILLYGERRIGTSSILRNIPFFVSQDEFLFVHCDLQTYSYTGLSEIWYGIFSNVFELLNLDISKLDILLSVDVNINIRATINNRLLPLVYDALDNKKMVFLLDEFDILTQNDTEEASEFLRFLDNLVKLNEELFVIAVVSRYIDSDSDFLQLNALQSLRGATYIHIGLLHKKSAECLIIEPANNILKYQSSAIEEIIKYTSGHPFYTQILCYEIFHLAMREDYAVIIPTFVNDVLEQAIESAEGGLGGFWDGLSIPERVVISAVAEAQKQNKSENPLKLLEAYGFVITDSLEKAIRLLTSKGFIEDNPTKLKVELVCYWLLKRHPLRDEIWSLETLERKNVESALNVARSLWQENKLETALSFYEQVLQLNPNHFSTVVELAEKYLQVEKFDEALELYHRAYKVDPASYQPELIQALDQYGHWLITESNFAKAKQQYEKILIVEPTNNLARQKIIEIKAFQESQQGWFGKAVAVFRRIFES